MLVDLQTNPWKIIFASPHLLSIAASCGAAILNNIKSQLYRTQEEDCKAKESPIVVCPNSPINVIVNSVAVAGAVYRSMASDEQSVEITVKIIGPARPTTPSSTSPPPSVITTPPPDVATAQLQKPGTGEGTWADLLILPTAQVCRMLVAAVGYKFFKTSYRVRLRCPLQSEGIQV